MNHLKSKLYTKRNLKIMYTYLYSMTKEKLNLIRQMTCCWIFHKTRYFIRIINIYLNMNVSISMFVMTETQSRLMPFTCLWMSKPRRYIIILPKKRTPLGTPWWGYTCWFPNTITMVVGFKREWHRKPNLTLNSQLSRTFW